jgi:hypothetical protein
MSTPTHYKEDWTWALLSLLCIVIPTQAFKSPTRLPLMAEEKEFPPHVSRLALTLKAQVPDFI